ncbi:MAG: preprotein translocase subunit SecE [Minisyncoccia bacterium]
MSKLTDYILETKTEMKHVSWPTRQQTIIFTVVIILVSVGVSVYLGLFDYIFSITLQKFIGF